jgi:signal transduction histidine kinase
MINEMLDLDRMESGRMTLHAERMDLNAVIDDVADRVGRTPRITRSRSICSPTCRSCADRDRLAQVASTS